MDDDEVINGGKMWHQRGKNLRQSRGVRIATYKTKPSRVGQFDKRTDDQGDTRRTLSKPWSIYPHKQGLVQILVSSSSGTTRRRDIRTNPFGAITWRISAPWRGRFVSFHYPCIADLLQTITGWHFVSSAHTMPVIPSSCTKVDG